MSPIAEQGIYSLQRKGRYMQVFPGSSLSAVKHLGHQLSIKISTWTGHIEMRDEKSQAVISQAMRKTWSSKYDVVIDTRAFVIERGSIWSSKRYFTLPSGMRCVAQRWSMTGQYVVMELQRNTILATFENSVSFRKVGVVRLFAPGHSKEDLIALFMSLIVMLKIAQDQQNSSAGAAGAAAGAGAGGGGGGC
ncbi:hypothetical protein E3P99_03047 [Wallemia hederae]|uniref:Tubby C-terminal domain-containing protein n=1 Tax=Wallemia hederae TaxID=1540922 RepID=A0A4T0FHQ2_9BASI|nr:hypothetical protein E3P99_03047 [Wallemia hederae]